MYNATMVDALGDNIADSHRMMKQISFRNLLVGALTAAVLFALSGFSAAAETEQRLIVKEVVIYKGGGYLYGCLAGRDNRRASQGAP